MASIDPAVLQRFRRKRLIRRTAAIAVTLALTVVLIEVLLRVTDPFGAVYFQDIAANFYDRAIADPRGYVVPAGEYHPARWSFTILPDYSRRVPDTAPDADKTMVFIGDSITFGYGVEDAETFVNLVARAFPDWHVINDSLPGWNIQNMEGAWAQHPDADLIFLLTITNDSDEPERTAADIRAWHPSYIEAYATVISWLLTGFPVPSAETTAALEPAWRASLTNIGSDPRVTFLTIRSTGGYWERVASMFPGRTVTLENYDGFISTVDSHPNPASHVFLAEQLIPQVAEKVAAFETP